MPRKVSSNRFLKPSIKWADVEKLVNPEERSKYLAFKGKSESYLRRVLANPPSPPAIKWDEYRKNIPDPSIVDKMKSAYEAFKVPYPADKLTASVDKQWSDLNTKIKKYCDEQQNIIKVAKKELHKINALPPFDVITMEMFHDMYPDHAIRPVEKPSFWPHSAEEQLGYVDPALEKSKH